MIEPNDRFAGALVGLAAGDALGTSLEFMHPGTFPPITDMEGGGPFNLLAGQWTDDTSMALCLGESLVRLGTFDPVDQCKNYVNWYHNGFMSSTGRCFDIGMTTSEALRNFIRTGEPYGASDSPNAAGNGSLMRLSPVPIFYHDDPEAAIHWSGMSSQTTHRAPQAIAACRYFAGLLIGAFQGKSKEELLSSKYAPIPGYWDENPLVLAVAGVAKGSFKDRQPPEIVGSGYVVDTLEAVLWAFYHTDNFRDGALKVVNLGDDADTTGAVYGQLAGAYYGYSDIPQEWRNKLHMHDEIHQMALDLTTARKEQ